MQDAGLIQWEIQTSCFFVGVQLIPLAFLTFQIRYIDCLLCMLRKQASKLLCVSLFLTISTCYCRGRSGVASEVAAVTSPFNIAFASTEKYEPIPDTVKRDIVEEGYLTVESEDALGSSVPPGFERNSDKPPAPTCVMPAVTIVDEDDIDDDDDDGNGNDDDDDGDGDEDTANAQPTFSQRAFAAFKAGGEQAKTRMLGTLPILIMFFLRQSYFISLIALYICGLTAATVLNGIYVLFLIVFLISDTLAFKYWVFLVLYTETVILAFIGWQVAPLDWDNDTVVQVIGLQHSSGLLVELVGWHIAILLFSLIQLIINRRMQQNNQVHASVVEQLQLNPILQVIISTMAALIKRYVTTMQ
jgi:hypothetical protein